MSFVPIPEALERIARGEIVIVVDGPDREDEGDLTMAARFATPESLNFMITHGRGLLCMPCEASRLDAAAHRADGPDQRCVLRHTVRRADRPPVDEHGHLRARPRDDDRRGPRHGSRPWDFRRPGHVFPLRARDRGVLERPGHTEASVDLCRAAGLEPVAVICEVLNEDGAVARVPDLERFAGVHGLAIAAIDDLIEYRTSTEGAAARAALA